jgi:hypothetical protein
MTNLDTVPETDAQVDAILDQATAELDANPAPEANATEATEPTKPSIPAPANPVKVTEKVPAAYAPAEDRENLRLILQDMLANGWTRPAIIKYTGLSDSRVYLAKEGKAHTSELELWVEFLGKVQSGEYQPPKSTRKPKVEDLEARITELEAEHAAKIQRALDVLADEATTVKQFRALVEAARAELAGQLADANA